MQRNDSKVLVRQPKAALTLTMFHTLWDLLKNIFVFLAVLLFRKGQEGDNTSHYVLIGAIALAILSLAYGFLKYQHFRYGVVGNNFIVKKGVFTIEELSIPIKDIQSINVEQTFLSKLLKLVSVRLDATGSESDDIKLHITELDLADLRNVLLAHQNEPVLNESVVAINEKETGPEQIISELSTPELVKLGLSANHLEMVGVFMALFFSFMKTIREFINSVFDKIIEDSIARFAASSILFIVFICIGILFISIIVSFGKTILKYSDFKISKHPKGLAIEMGLLHKYEQLVQTKKIQYVSWKSNWLRKKLPIFLLQYHTIGEDDEKKVQVKMPITSAKLLEKLILYYHPQANLNDPYFSISEKYIIRKTIVLGLLPMLLIGAVLYYNFGFIALSIFPVPILAYFYFRKKQRNFKVYLNQKVLQISKGVFGIHHILLKWDKVQTASVSQSLYQQRHNLANIHLESAGGTIVIPFIDLEDAQRLFNYTTYKVENEEKHNWM